MNIRGRILLVLVAATLVPLYLVGWLTLSANARSSADREDTLLRVRADELSNDIDGFVRATQEALRADSGQPIFVRYLSSDADARRKLDSEVRSALRSVAVKDPIHVMSAALIDGAARVLADTRFLPGQSEQERSSPCVADALTQGVSALDGPRAEGPADSAFILFCHPVRDSRGHILGILRLRVSAARLQAIVWRQGLNEASGRYVMVLTPDGVVAAHSTRPEWLLRARLGGDEKSDAVLRREHRLVGKGETERLNGVLPAVQRTSVLAWVTVSDGRLRMAVAQVRDTPWRVVVFTPEAAWRAGFDAELRTILLLGGITTLLLLVASWWVAGRISGPIVRLTEVADRIGRDAAQPELPVDADGEVGRLARALQSMMRRLDEARATLAQQVEEQRATALRLQISESRLTALFNLSPLPLLLSDRESGEVMDVNAAFVTQFGAVAASLAGASLASLSGDARFPSFYTLARQLQLQGDVDQVVPVRHDGEASFMRTFGRAFEAGARKLAIWTCVDVTETENARRALEELNASLEGRVEQRTNALRETLQHLQLAQDELVRSEKLAALGSLVAGVAHELNTPLGNSVTVASTIGELTSRLAEDLAGGRLRRSQLDEFVVAMQSAADLITRNLARARTLVTSFKQVSVDRVSEGRRRFDLAEVINEVAATLAPGLKGQPGRLDLDLAPVEMDSFPGAIGQIITNLVNNAMLHAFEGRDDGLVVLSCRHLPDGFAELVCRDDGSGMDAETLRRIFDPFFTTKFGRGGSGLGMHIVYNLVTRGLGGTIEVASQPGSGARFRIVMPCVAPAHAD